MRVLFSDFSLRTLEQDPGTKLHLQDSETGSPEGIFYANFDSEWGKCYLFSVNLIKSEVKKEK
jgi:hypothetical protein